jgi:thioredoxin 1
MNSNFIEIESEEQFEQLKLKENLVVDFYAHWCGPCKGMLATINSVLDDFTDVTFCKVNVDEMGELAINHKVRSIPAVFFYKNGEQVHNFVGVESSKSFKDKLTNHFN